MFKGKSKKVKKQLLADAERLRQTALDNVMMTGKFSSEMQTLIDKLETTTFVKSKDETLSLSNFQSIMMNIASACEAGNEGEAVSACKIFTDNLKSMSTSGLSKPKKQPKYKPEQLVKIMLDRLNGAAQMYTYEAADLDKQRMKLEDKLVADPYNAAIASSLEMIRMDIDINGKKTKTVMDQIAMYNDEKLRAALVECMKKLSETEQAILANQQTTDEQLALIQRKYHEAMDRSGQRVAKTKEVEYDFDNAGKSETQGVSTDKVDYTEKASSGNERVNYAKKLLGKTTDGDEEPKSDDFKNVEEAINGYNLEALYYKYKVQDASEERDKLVSEVKGLLKKRDTASEVERMTLDGDIRAKNNQVEALTQSIKRYQSAWSGAEQKAGVAKRVITEKDISTAQSYNQFAKEFESNLQEYAMELSRRAEQRNVEAGDLAAITEIIDSVQPDFEMGLSGTPMAEAEEDSSAEFDEMKKKYGV